MAATVQLTMEACRALVAEARREFDNGAVELWRSRDESQRPTLEAAIEIIGQLEGVLPLWPSHETSFGRELDPHIEVEFSTATMDWLERQRESQAGYVEDLDRGVDGVGEPDYVAKQVYLLHVLDRIAAQRADALVDRAYDELRSDG